MESVLVSAEPPGLGDAEMAAVVAVLGAILGATVVEPAAVGAAVVPVVGASVVAVVGARVVANKFGKIPPPGKKSLATRP